MSIPIWPIEIPKPTRQGYSAQNQDPRLRKNADTGPTGYRRRWSSVARTVNLTVIVSRSGKATFDRFYNDTTAHGHKPFYLPDPVTDGWSLFSDNNVQLLTDDDRPITLAAQWLCLFGDSTPTETIKGLEFVISFSVEVMP
jgi:hypothetical protein